VAVHVGEPISNDEELTVGKEVAENVNRKVPEPTTRRLPKVATPLTDATAVVPESWPPEPTSEAVTTVDADPTLKPVLSLISITG
jgi:hypothetical protein